MTNDEIQERAIENGRNIPGCPEQWTFSNESRSEGGGQAMRVRFWLWWNQGFVKITLREEQHTEDEPLVLYACGKSDEGWWSETELYWLDCGTVYRELIDDGRGCDGRLTTTSRDYCQPSNLFLNKPGEYTPDPDVMLPDWKPARSEVYDEYAQAMGY